MRYIQQQFVAVLRQKGVTSGSLLDAMAAVPRHSFVSEALRYRAYDDAPLPIGHGQTVSTPSVIGAMVQALGLTGGERVLEIGTGSGYQSAILSRLAGSLVTMERIGDIIERARGTLFRLGYRNISFIHSSDFTEAPGLFDAIIVSAGAGILPVPLLEKLLPGGRLVIPLGGESGHRIWRYVLKNDGMVASEEIGEARFVPYICSESA